MTSFRTLLAIAAVTVSLLVPVTSEAYRGAYETYERREYYDGPRYRSYDDGYDYEYSRPYYGPRSGVSVFLPVPSFIFDFGHHGGHGWHGGDGYGDGYGHGGGHWSHHGYRGHHGRHH